MLRTILFFLIIIFALIGCSPQPTLPPSGKMTPPLEAKLDIENSSLNSDAIKLTLKVTFKNAEWKAEAALEEKRGH